MVAIQRDRRPSRAEQIAAEVNFRDTINRLTFESRQARLTRQRRSAQRQEMHLQALSDEKHRGESDA